MKQIEPGFFVMDEQKLAKELEKEKLIKDYVTAKKSKVSLEQRLEIIEKILGIR